ncbi:Colicin V production protein [Candidatus Coxiella mudrowiae]|uniref:Colicin V production protein n=1 Tax=Candidatus Coxiella mudrowiae TaxID=2054173 RepID=A0ABM5UUQ8_9COXI|nr:Colicin V production protein [Candidatus Coxiella mudrowiae]
MNFNIFSHFNWVDFTIIGIIVFSIIISFFRGFVREAISLVIWIGAIVIAFKFSEPVQIHLRPWINLDSLRYAATFGILFLAVFIFGIFINLIIHVLVKKTGLTITDRLLGIFFGAARGLLIVAIFLIFVSVGNIKDGTAVSQSQLASKFEPIVTRLNQFLPWQLKNIFQWLVEPPQTEVNRGDMVMCGIVGIISHNQVNQAIYDWLTILQHRGQDPAGIMKVIASGFFTKIK